MKKKLHLIAGARPNFMKIAPLYHALEKEPWCETQIIHTGQHYDPSLSDIFFKQLKLPRPHICLEVGSGSHSEQTAKVMIAYEKICLTEKPDLVIVVGDINSTVAAALTTKKLCIPLAHLEAGLRSWDKTMPEEINRIVTDSISDFFWTPSSDGDDNLIKSGVAPSQIRMVGNIMIDSYVMLSQEIKENSTRSHFNLKEHQYGVVTLHRPANVDDPETLKSICQSIISAAQEFPVIFPVHPRTRLKLEKAGLQSYFETSKIRLIEPLGYIEFMNLVSTSALVLTDSGGVQEETTYLGIPCLTLRPNTERPITITHGTNCLINTNSLLETLKSLKRKNVDYQPPPLWDGHTADRIVSHLKEIFSTLLFLTST